MTWKSLLGRVLCGSIVACSAQDVRLSGTIAGFVFDRPSRSLRQVVGMPGAALLGRAVLADVDWASVAPSGRVALVMRQGEARLFSAGQDPAEALIQGSVNAPLYSAWASDSSAVALYSAAGSSVQWVRLTQQGPIADPAVPLSWEGEADVTAFAADEKSRLAILAVAGRGVYRAGVSGHPVLLLPVADASALALEPGGQTLWISDRTNAQLVQISEPAAAAEPQVIGADVDRLADLSAIALSSDGKRLYLANRSTRRLYMLDRASALMMNSRKTDSAAAGVGREFGNGWGPRPAFALLSDGIALDATATMFLQLGRPSVFLLGQRAEMGESLFLLDENAGPGVFFVPAMEEK